MKNAIARVAARARRLSYFLGSFLFAFMTFNAAAGPEGGVIRRGEGSIVRPDARTTIINQHTRRMVIDWQHFDVAANEQVNFRQPDSNAAVLNRIFDQNPSRIFGQINANGRVLLSNANGILFGGSASVNVGSLFATSLGIHPDDFMGGDWNFSANGEPGAIVNHGLLNAANGGFVALVGGGVMNDGVIVANYGEVILGAGTQATVDFDGDGLIQFQVDGDLQENIASLNAAVANSGVIQAQEGMVVLTANTAREIFNRAVNNGGIIEASGVNNDGGHVFLSGGAGDAVNAGVIDVSSANARGGRVEMTGARVGLFGDALIDASGRVHGGEVIAGGDLAGSGDVATAEMTIMGPNAIVDASSSHGDGGTVVLWADGYTRFNGMIDATGVTSDRGGLVETSGKESLDVTGTVLAREWLLDPRNVTIDSAATSGGGFDGGNPDTFTPTGDDAVVDANTINTALTGGTDVIITTADATGLQAGDITVNAAIAGTAGGAALTLLADGSIFVNADITAGAVTLTAQDSIGINALIATGGGDFTATAAAGDVSITGLPLATIDAGAGSVTIAAGQDILDGNNDAAGTGSSISSTSQVSLTAGRHIGAAAQGDINVIDASVVSLSAGGDIHYTTDATLSSLALTLAPSGGDVYSIVAGGGSTFVLSDNGGLLVTTINNGGTTLDLDVTTTSGDIQLLDGAIGNIGVGDVGLHAFGAIVDGDGSTTTAISTNGNVELTAGNGIGVADAIDVATTNLSGSAGGDVQIINSATSAVTLSEFATTGAFSFENTAPSLSIGTTSNGITAGSDVSVQSSGNIVLGDATGGGKGIDAAGQLVVVDSGGSIRDNGSTIKIVADALLLSGRFGVGSALNVLDVATNTLAASAGSLVKINNAGDLHVGTVDGVSGISAFGIIALDVSGDLTGDQAMQTSGSAGIEISATGNIGTSISALSISAAAGGVSLSSGGDIYVDSSSNLRLDALQTNGSSVNSVHIQANNNILLNTDSHTSLLGDNVTFEMNSGGTVDTAGHLVNLGAGSLTLITDQLLNVASGDITANGGIRISTSTAGGVIGLGSVVAGNLVLSDAQIGTLINAAGAGGLTVGDATAGNVVIEGVIVGSTDDLTIKTGGTINDVDASSAFIGGRLVLEAGNGIGTTGPMNIAAVSLDAEVTGPGNINIAEANALTVDRAVTNNGSITIITGGALNATLVDASGTDSDLNDIVLRGDAIQAGVINASNTGDVTLGATTGAITDGNGAGTINISGDVLIADAATGIDLDTAVTSLDLGVSGAGGIDIAEADDLAVTDARTANGNIALSGASLGIGTIAAGSGGDVNLDATGTITDGNGAGIVNVSGDVLVADAVTGIDLDTAVASLDLGVSGAGGIDIADANDLTVTDVRTANGNIALSGVNLGIGTIVAGSGGDVNLEATGAITDANGATANISADVLTVNSVTGIDLDTTVTSVDAGVSGVGTINLSDTDDLMVTRMQTANGDITVSAANLSIDIITAGSGGNVDLNAIGAITDANGAGAGNISANVLVADAATGVDLDTSIAGADLSVSGTGGTVIRETDGIQLTDIDVNNGSIDITAGGAIAAADVRTFTNSDTNDITLTGSTIQAGVIGASGAGDVMLTATTGGITDANGDGTNNISGDTLIADAATGIDLDTAVASVDLQVSGSGAINIADTDDLAVTDVQTANGDIVLSAASLAIDSISAGSGRNIGLEATTGAITDSNAADVNVVGGVLEADAATGIDLDVTISSLDVESAGTGGINISESDSLTITNAHSVDGDITISAAGDIAVVSMSTLSLRDIQLSAMAGAITDGNGAGSNINTDILTASARDGIDLDTTVNSVNLDVSGAAGDIRIDESNALVIASVDINNGNVDIVGNGDLYVGDISLLDSDASGDTVTLVSINASINDAGDDALNDITAPNIVLRATNGSVGGSPKPPGSPANPDDPVGAIELDGNFTVTAGVDVALADVSGSLDPVTLDVTSGGSFAFNRAGDILVDRINAQGDVSLTSRDGSINDLQDDGIADIVITGSPDAQISLTAADEIGGLPGAGSTGGDGNRGSIEISGADTIDANAAGGNIVLTAQDAVILGSVNAAAGSIDIAVDGNAEIDSVIASGNVALNIDGAITDSNAISGNIRGDLVALAAQTAIGASSGRIDVSAETLDASVEAGAGGIFLAEADDVILQDIDTVNGDIDIVAAGAVTAANVQAGGGDITLRGTAIEVGVVNTGSGNAALTATTGSITDTNRDSDVTARDLTLLASSGGVGQGNAISTRVVRLLEGEAGNGIAIDERDALVIADLAVTGGAVDIQAGGLVEIGNLRNTGGTNADDVTIRGNGINTGSVTTSGAGDVRLDAGTGAISDGNAAGMNVAADELTADARGGIDLDTRVRTLSLAISGSGSLAIREEDDVTLNRAAVADGAIGISSGGTISLATDLLTDGDAITLAGDIALLGDRSISTGTAGNIELSGTVAGSGNDLVLDAGDGVVAVNELSSIGVLAVTAGTWQTNGEISVADHDFSGMDGARWMLVGNTALVTAGGAIDLSGFVSVSATTDGSAGLELDAGSADVDVTDVHLGDEGALKHVKLTGGSIRAGVVLTTGNQRYAGNVELGGNLDSTNGGVHLAGDVTLLRDIRIEAAGDVAVDGSVNGAKSLLVSSGGDVAFRDGIGQGEALRSLNVTGDTINTSAVITVGEQQYNGNALVSGDLTGGSLLFGGAVQFPSGAVLTADTIEFNGGAHSVSGGGELTLVPATVGTSIDLGGAGAALNLDADALDGYDEGLVIGGFVDGLSVTPVAGSIAVNDGIDVGSGYLVLLSTEGIALHAGTLSGAELTLIAGSQDGTITNDGGFETLLEAGKVTLVAGGGIGEDGKDIRARGNGAGSSIEIASGASEVFVETGNTLRELTGGNALFANAIASGLKLITDDGVKITSTLQSSANREQGTGLTDEGFIDASLFEEISLYETAGAGILMPLDQSEEMPEEGCVTDSTGSLRCNETLTGSVAVPGVAPHGAPR